MLPAGALWISPPRRVLHRQHSTPPFAGPSLVEAYWRWKDCDVATGIAHAPAGSSTLLGRGVLVPCRYPHDLHAAMPKDCPCPESTHSEALMSIHSSEGELPRRLLAIA
jgi:hypothetical protein